MGLGAEWLRGYNEMCRYEPAMNELRALAQWIVDKGEAVPAELAARGSWEGDLFQLIKFYTSRLAEDIDSYNRILPETLNLLENAVRTTRRVLGISDDDVEAASQAQLFAGSGFWEMRRFLGQFPDMAAEIAGWRPRQLVCSGISGCVIGEYVGLLLAKRGMVVPVDHLVYRRRGVWPVEGRLARDFRWAGGKVLLIEDAVNEPRTLQVMMRALRSKAWLQMNFGLLVLEVDRDKAGVAQLLNGFDRVFEFEEGI